ncbi:9944_t:CDS:1 [Funneliformis caledonium]|uniref:9944_t:CDS:1 n=1 Tax=Funneliformis caledonium TaxID=1117310 RepID=A0A9N9C6B0_9GLOM|nr:9944_t:CDS:1 [Funneliformis caledonium]
MQNFETLITCLPKKSKAILYKNGIIISTSRPPLFNYIAFIKRLDINEINSAITRFTPKILDNNQILVTTQEIFKMLMNQTSLKILHFEFKSNDDIPNIPFTAYPGGKDCLSKLSEFSCSSNIYPEFFYQISRICHNLQSLKINFKSFISKGLTELISVQKDLKYLDLNYCEGYSDESDLDYCESNLDGSDLDYCDCKLDDESQLLANIPNTLNKLHIFGRPCHMQLSFISKLSNLQELSLSFLKTNGLKDFEILQYATLPKLQILTFEIKCAAVVYLINFLENNGKNLKKLDLGKKKFFDNSLNLAISNFCTNLTSLRFTYSYKTLDSLKLILNGCEQLESMDILSSVNCRGCQDFILLEMIVEFSPKKFHELKVDMGSCVDQVIAFQWGFEPIFKCWANRVPCIPLSLTINSKLESEITMEESNVKVIEEFIKLGVIKEIKIFNDISWFC